MKPLDIIVIICCILIVGGVIGNFIYRKIKKLPTGDCGCCSHSKSNLVDKYHKKYKCNCCKNKD